MYQKGSFLRQNVGNSVSLRAVPESLTLAIVCDGVKAGLRNARAKGKRLGRPKVSVSATTSQELRAQGLTWRDIAGCCRVSKTTVIRASK